ncbi:hypothetical protein QR680_016042 [Steinernema hermaphroditum]|uniref:Hexosyltransferase n=1 Tax=Steinernema hermaphroditum TaxID=289476 RepID=A0AA39HCD4_9BILA|nr:hypothetical protein QR680_016042 [Steinernema hermaphroditum]
MQSKILRPTLLIVTVLAIEHILILYWSREAQTTKSLNETKILVVNATFANCHFGYEITTEFSADRCTNKKLFVFVMTVVPSFEQRSMIRRTWASKNHTADSVVVFIVGHVQNIDHNALLYAENLVHGDIVRTNIPDAYNFTAMKIHAGYYLHTKYCANVPFVLRTDDDVVVLPDRFVHFASNGYFGNEQKAIYGLILKGSKPFRDPAHKWYIPHDYYASEEYPPYMNGPAYFMTAQSTRAILDKTDNTTFFWIEDVMFTGIMANKTGVKLVDSRELFKFHCSEKERQEGVRIGDSDDLCLRELSYCDKSGVPYATIIYHVPDSKRTNVEDGYMELTRAACSEHKTLHLG